MKASPRFSIVIPAYNEARFIAGCLESLKSQNTKTSFEIIIVDNGSTDSTDKIAESFGARVVYEKRKGVCWARQAGFKAAKGEIVISTDADTEFKPNWLANIEKGFNKKTRRNGIVAVSGPVRYSGGPLWGRVWAHILFGFVAIWAKLLSRPPYVSACNLAFRKDSFDGYNTELTQGGDELDVLRRIKKRGRVVYLPRNYTITSSRRFVRGFVYNFFVSFLVYYVLDYTISRFTKKSPFGSWHDYRNEVEPRTLAFIQFIVVTLLVFGFLVLTRPGQYIYRHVYHYVRSAQGEIKDKL